jgi:hypothetical protein
MRRRSLVLALVLSACGRTGLDLGADPIADAPGAPDAASPTGPDAAASRSCVWSGFATKGMYPTGIGPVSIAVADFDGDGRPDLATSNWGGALGSMDGSVSVLLANGPGTFAAQTMYATEIQPNDVAAGDLTGDGRPDLLVAGGLTTLNAFRNAGDGTFTPLPGAHLSEPLALALGDLDGDGHLDVAATMGSNAVDVYLGKGDGRLRPAGQYATGDMADAIAAADLNGDGHLDLVVTNVVYPPGRGLPVALGMGWIAVFINRGGGMFEDAVLYAAGNGTNALAVADLDGDGHLDVAVANDVDGTIGVFRNAGDGTFGAQVAWGIGQTSSSVNGGGMAGVVAADFNGDGRVDLATARTLEGNATVEVLLNEDDASFTHVSGPATPDNPEAIATGDFDGDGHPDLAISGQKSVTVLLDRCR